MVQPARGAGTPAGPGAAANGRAAGGLVLVGLFAAGWFFSLLLLALTGLAGAHAMLALRGEPDGDAVALTSTAGFMAALLPVQLAVMVALVGAAHALAQRWWYAPRGAASLGPGGWRGVLGLHATPWLVLLVAALVGATVGWAPSYIAEGLMVRFPSSDGGTLGAVATAMAAGDPLSRAALVVEIGLMAPLAEELVFRGFLWDALRRSYPASLAWLVSSVLFAAYHLDPVHATAVLFTGFVLGALRWGSGSVWPGVVAHAVNNLAAVLSLWWVAGVDEATTATSPWMALCGAVLSVAGCVLVVFLRARGAVPATDGRST